MSRILSVLAVLALLALPALAEDPARVEVFGGFQYFRANSGVPDVDNFNLNGWNASLSGYFNRFLGVTADFGGVYGSPEVLGVPIHTKVHTFMFGPVVRLSNPTHITPFVHALGGASHTSGDVEGLSGGETDAAWAVGGGLDLDMGRVLSIRPVQVDFLQTRTDRGGQSVHQNNFRYSGGIVIKF